MHGGHPRLAAYALLSHCAPSSVRVAVAMMQVRIVRMLVHDRRVPMPVRVRFARRVPGRMVMPMVLVMGMPVFMLRGRVGVLVLMPLGQMQEEPDRHERGGERELHRHRLRRRRPPRAPRR